MAYELKATDLVQPLGRFSRAQFGIVLLGAAAATGILLAAARERVLQLAGGQRAY